jgi:hypothetical protein
MPFTLEELGKKVQLLEDIEEIKKLHTEYIFFVSNSQWDDVSECFAEDATADIGSHGICNGKKEISEMFHNVMSKVIKPTHGHFLGQPVISVEGDRAKGQWIMYRFLPDPGVNWTQGRYDCEYVKVGRKWKFSVVKFNRWPALPK